MFPVYHSLEFLLYLLNYKEFESRIHLKYYNMPVIKYLGTAKCCSKWFTCVSMKIFNPHNNRVRLLINICKWYFLFVTNRCLFLRMNRVYEASIILRIEWCSLIFGQFTRFSRRLSNDCKFCCLSCWANGESCNIKIICMPA